MNPELYSVQLEAGDVLYIPEGWVQSMSAKGSSVSILLAAEEEMEICRELVVTYSEDEYGNIITTETVSCS